MRSATMETMKSQQPIINGNAHLANSHRKAQKPPKRHISTHLTASYPSQSLRFLQKLENLKPYNIEEDANVKRPTQARLRLNIVIVGAGLGGLSLAIALARRGHSVRILE
jgi:salicylate hydroxylase